MMSHQPSLSAAHSSTSSQTYRIPLTKSQTRLFLLRPGGRFKQPIQLDAEQIEGGQWAITNSEIMTYGVGDTIDEAVDDFKSMVLDYFDELATSENVLAPRLKKQLRHLRTLISEEYEN